MFLSALSQSSRLSQMSSGEEGAYFWNSGFAVSEFRAVVQRNVNQLVLYLNDSYYYNRKT